MVDVLLLVAVMATENTECLVNNIEDGCHRLIVGDAFRVVALHDAVQFIGGDDCLFLNHLVVMDDTQYDVGSHHRQTGNLIVGEIAVTHLDDAFLPYFVGRVVETDGHGGGQMGKAKEVDNLEGLVRGDMVDNGAVFDGGY